MVLVTYETGFSEIISQTAAAKKCGVASIEVLIQ